MENVKRGNRRNHKVAVEKQKKRSSKHKKNAERRSYKAFFIFLLLFSITTVITLSLTVFFLVTDIVVEGNTHYSSEKIVEMSGLQVEENIFRINKKEAQEKIEKNMPYIYALRIERRLPTTIAIVVEEISPVCAIDGGSNEILLDIHGRALEVVPNLSRGSFPAVVGSDVETIYLGQAVFSSEWLQKNYALMLQTLMQADLLGKITQIDIENAHDLSFVYEDRIKVFLGDNTIFEDKIASFVLLVKEEIGPSAEGEMDISNPDKIHFVPLGG